MKYLIIAFLPLIFLSCNTKEDKFVITLTSPSGKLLPNSLTPYLVNAEDGKTYLSFLQKQDNITTLFWSSWQDSTWTNPRPIATGKNWFVNWADYPGISVHKDGTMLAWFLQKNDSATFAYQVMITMSIDKGVTWTVPKPLHDDNTPTEHGFVSAVPYQDGFFICWLDGRKTNMGADHEAMGHLGEMTLRCAIIGKDGTKQNEWETDSKVCDCCQTTAGIANDGPLVIYRNRSDDEIRDMNIVRFEKDKWTAPDTLHDQHWQIEACPVNGPRLDVKNNNVAVVYFGAPGGNASVYVKFSADGGKSFGQASRLDHGKPTGRVDICWINDNYAAATWMESEKLWLAIINKNGTIQLSEPIAERSSKRSSGFPQLTTCGENLILAWTNNETQQVETMIVHYKSR